LAALRTYRHILAAFLLAAYAFIAAPVQLWHHHKYIATVTAGPVSAAVKGDIVSPDTNSSTEANCPVCSHKYSIFANDALVPPIPAVFVPVAKCGCYRLQLISFTSLSLPNKGPPSLA
jgi:hypothetical protein